jgi:hypothetical protein
MIVWPRSSLFSRQSFSHRSSLTLRGKVVSVDRGEPLARVQVAVLVEAQREAVATAITTKDLRPPELSSRSESVLLPYLGRPAPHGERFCQLPA